VTLMPDCKLENRLSGGERGNAAHALKMCLDAMQTAVFKMSAAGVDAAPVAAE
jgi:hypothetical protein